MSDQANLQLCQWDASYCKFGAETVLDLVEGFMENIDGVIENDDVECVHKTRVSSRKLRAALPLFERCFPKKDFKKWSKQIKKVTCLLGNARDLDVQIAFVKKYMEKLDLTEKKYMNTLLTERKNQRKSAQPSVSKGLEKLKASGILQDISDFCQDTIVEQSNISFDPNQVLEKAQWHIAFRLDGFLALQNYVHQEDEDKKHHEMRINAKKLRYTMEFFAPLLKTNSKKKSIL